MEYSENGLKVHVTFDKNILKLAIVKTLAEEGEVHSSQLRELLVKPLLVKLEKELGRIEISATMFDLHKDGILSEGEYKIVKQATPEESGRVSKVYRLKGPE